MNVDGSHQRALTSTTDWVWNFAWSPDGEQLAYDLSVNTLPPEETNIYLVSSDGTERTSIHVTNPPGSLGSIAWRPLVGI
jgi:Tol biopolymer transport system component